jgi:uncharacterized protein (TIGR03435 family)
MRPVLTALAAATALAAQQPAPKFEVVSIRLVPPNTPPTLRAQDYTSVFPGGQFIDPRTPLSFMMAFAYNLKNLDLQLVGLPNWAKDQTYSVAAKPSEDFPALPPGENREQVRLMMRAMLADRFQLRLHSETRQETVLALTVGNGGLKVNEVSAPVPPEKEGPVHAAVGDRNGRMIAHKATMQGLASVLTLFLKRPVIDQTGLRGYYDFDIRWSAPEAAGAQPPTPGLGSEGEALLISNLQIKFGLRLSKTLGQVEYWVVDHIEPPTGN